MITDVDNHRYSHVYRAIFFGCQYDARGSKIGLRIPFS